MTEQRDDGDTRRQRDGAPDETNDAVEPVDSPPVRVGGQVRERKSLDNNEERTQRVHRHPERLRRVRELRPRRRRRIRSRPRNRERNDEDAGKHFAERE